MIPSESWKELKFEFRQGQELVENHQIQSPFSPVSDMLPGQLHCFKPSFSDFLSDFLWHRILAQAIDTMRFTWMFRGTHKQKLGRSNGGVMTCYDSFGTFSPNSNAFGFSWKQALRL